MPEELVQPEFDKSSACKRDLKSTLQEVMFSFNLVQYNGPHMFICLCAIDSTFSLIYMSTVSHRLITESISNQSLHRLDGNL